MHATTYRADPWLLDLTYFQDFAHSRLAEIDLQRETGELVRARHNLHEVAMVITDKLAGHMKMLDLGVYQDRSGNLLVGSNDEALHPHDRWLYQAPVPRDGNMQWYDIYHHQPRDLNNPVSHSAPFSDLPFTIENTLLQVQRMGMADQPSHYWALHHVSANIGFPLQRLLKTTRLSPWQLHEILFHYHTFTTNNPEMAGLPRDLVRRMHGLGPIVEIGANLKPNLISPAYQLDLG